MPSCRECGTRLLVDRDLCRTCRRRIAGRRARAAEAAARQPHKPVQLEPPHSRPWIHRGGG